MTKPNLQDAVLPTTLAQYMLVLRDLQYTESERDSWATRAAASKREYESHLEQEAKANVEVERQKEIFRKAHKNLETI